MNTTLSEFITAEIAALPRVVSTPVAPFYFGSDVTCVTDLVETMDEIPGNTTRALAEAIVRRLDCPRGALPDDADYGIDLRQRCNRGTVADDIRSLAAQIRNELLKDDRIDMLSVTVTPSPDGGTITVQLAVTPKNPEIGGFSLTLAVTSASVLLAEMNK
jgi:hypothetical protein